MGQELIPARFAVQEPMSCPRTMKENLAFGHVEMHCQKIDTKPGSSSKLQTQPAYGRPERLDPVKSLVMLPSPQIVSWDLTKRPKQSQVKKKHSRKRVSSR